MIRRWLSCANQSDGPTETKVGLQAPPNRILHSSFLAVPHMTWWVNFVSKSCRFFKHRLQYNPRTMWPPSETDTSRPKQGKRCWHAPEWTPSSALLLVWQGNTSHTSLCSTPICCPGKMFSSFKQEEDPDMMHGMLVAPVTHCSCPPQHSHSLPPLALIAAGTRKVGHWL